MHKSFCGPRAALRCFLTAPVFAWALSAPVDAATYTESVDGEISADRLAPSFLQLDFPASGNVPGSNVITGTVGRNATSRAIDLDYLWINVPVGYQLSELRVGNQTTVGGSGSFIGLATGVTMAVPGNAANATGLLGYRVYGAGDRGTDILDDMAVPTNGSSGFTRPLSAGNYTLWIQELSTGTFTYRFNLVLSPVPEPATASLLMVGLGLLATAGRCLRRRDPRSR